MSRPSITTVQSCLFLATPCIQRPIKLVKALTAIDEEMERIRGKVQTKTVHFILSFATSRIRNLNLNLKLEIVEIFAYDTSPTTTNSHFLATFYIHIHVSPSQIFSAHNLCRVTSTCWFGHLRTANPTKHSVKNPPDVKFKFLSTDILAYFV
ncbi:uncharacterized protein BDR25DRAFT_359613 [Lindgomyces ingoldianus]|uniref:Uncharacterized protein n=1 Tax=Lindgomyces ingoldianus TaxID=673940 RepID=A0ACB6QH00_9PLEO|nr:uncharacterized protein BDR25DRAFT_359613 [Lindgomyces ingoldianus]KAF2466248.1 hypothetical protein BDR25DRAFT_359613 [Lindgomyces ingoldianus]